MNLGARWRDANAALSPSVTLEQGVNRLRPPVKRRPPPSPTPLSRRPRTPLQTVPSRRGPSKLFTSISVAVLILTTYLIYRIFFWLWASARWDAFTDGLSHRISPPKFELYPRPLDQLTPSLPSPQSPPKNTHTLLSGHTSSYVHMPSSETLNPSQKFLAWLPHSGFHNQRVSFENALVLAHILNRTLVVPPIRLGLAIRYVEFDKLYRHLTLSSKIGLEHCSMFASPDSLRIPLPRECIGYDEYTMLSWAALVDLDSIAEFQPLVERWDSSNAWFSQYLNVTPGETMYLKDERPYQYRIYDDLQDHQSLKSNYDERLDVENLRDTSDRYRLLHIGTLFGTTRLRLNLIENVQLRRKFREHMVFRNPLFEAGRVIDS